MASSNQNADKENVFRTRIPIPKAPLPPLPKHLLVNTKKVRKQEGPKRRPLETINIESTITPKPGPSKEVPQKPDKPMNIDLDKRGKDKNASIISISDDDLEDEGSQRHFVDREKEKGAVLSAVMPNLQVNLEPNRVMQKHHSRELQGLAPIVARQETPDVTVKHRVRLNKNTQDCSTPPDFWKRAYMRSLYRDHKTDVFEYLMAKEVKPLQMPRISSTTRAGVINWLMKINGADGDPAIVQAACWYFDSVVGLTNVQQDKLQLIGAACLSIIQKLNGPYIPAMTLVKHSNPAFTADKLQATEKAVMNKLNSPTQPIVPQDYITYLSWKCDSPNAGDIELAATFLAMCGLLVDRSLCNEYPSVVAVAAVINALLLLKKTELIPHLHKCKIFIAAEKKAANLSNTCSILRRAVRTVASASYPHKTPLDHYDVPPCRIINRIVRAATRSAI